MGCTRPGVCPDTAGRNVQGKVSLIWKGEGYMSSNNSLTQELITHIFKFLDVLSGQRLASSEPIGWVQHDSPYLRLQKVQQLYKHSVTFFFNTPKDRTRRNSTNEPLSLLCWGRLVGFTDHDGNQSLRHNVSPHGALQLNPTENAPDQALLLDAIHLPVESSSSSSSYFIRSQVGQTWSGCKMQTRSVCWYPDAIATLPQWCNMRLCPLEDANVSRHFSIFSPWNSLPANLALCLQLPNNSVGLFFLGLLLMYFCPFFFLLLVWFPDTSIILFTVCNFSQ